MVERGYVCMYPSSRSFCQTHNFSPKQKTEQGRSLPRLSVSFKCCPGLTTGRIYAWKEPPILSETVDLNYVSGENTTPGMLLLLSCAAASEWFCVLRGGGWSSVGMYVCIPQVEGFVVISTRFPYVVL
jgi:hypothetical protein